MTCHGMHSVRMMCTIARPHAQRFRICPLGRCKSSQPSPMTVITPSPIMFFAKKDFLASKSPSVMIFFPAFTNSWNQPWNKSSTRNKKNLDFGFPAFHITDVSSGIFSSRFWKTQRFSLVLSASQKRQKSNCLQAFTLHALCYHQNAVATPETCAAKIPQTVCLGFLAPTWKKLSHLFISVLWSFLLSAISYARDVHHFPTTSAISLVSTSVFCVGSCPFGSKFSARDLTRQSGANLWRHKNNHLSCNCIDLFRLI